MERVLVITPLQIEFEGLCAYLGEMGHQREVVAGRTPTWLFPSLDLEVAVGGHGKAKFATIAQYLLLRGQMPRAVLAAGAAGSLDSSVTLGDVVLGAHTIEHDYRIRFGGPRLAPRYPCNGELLESIWSARPEQGRFQTHSGAIASGDEDIVSAARKRALHMETGALCVAWEGAGGAKAARFQRVPFLELRAITDESDSASLSGFESRIQTGMENLGTLLLSWLG